MIAIEMAKCHDLAIKRQIERLLTEKWMSTLSLVFLFDFSEKSKITKNEKNRSIEIILTWETMETVARHDRRIDQPMAQFVTNICESGEKNEWRRKKEKGKNVK